MGPRRAEVLGIKSREERLNGRQTLVPVGRAVRSGLVHAVHALCSLPFLFIFR